MGYNDARDWIALLEQAGELKRIHAEVDWDLEIGGITRCVFDNQGPALLFENIKGYQQGRCRKLFVGGLGTPKRLSLSLGLSENATIREQIDLVHKRFKERVKPAVVSTGPVKENIITGKEINIEDFPVPKWHPQDGGRYINTTAGVVTKDPDSDWINVGIYRGMVAGGDKIGTGIAAAQHGGSMLVKYRERGEGMPIALIYGGDPSMFFVACAGIPTHVSEYEIMGAIRQKPVELVKCETNDLMVPADAEIVIEGTLSTDPNDFVMEGPFGEYTGYYGGARSLKPAIKVECITHRNDPIFQGTLEGFGPHHPNEDSICTQVSCSANVKNVLEASGIPGVIDAYMLPGSCVNNAVIQIRKSYQGQAKQIGLSVWGSHLPYWQCKNIIVVEEDIDIYDFTALEWAVAYRVNPAMDDLVVVPGLPGSPLDPSTPLDQRGDMARLGAGRWNRILIDATKSWLLTPEEQWKGEIYPPVSFILDSGVKSLVEKRWKEYGF
ncbi:MAG: UbiD family decarboxylase [Thermodesulfobacteriota bacterium]|nr:UbiD family decarboxylase [Thermodesulfobacteriota bacterium]